MRISLGLKPLVIGDGGAAKAEAEKRAAERAEEARRVQAEELAERVKACVLQNCSSYLPVQFYLVAVLIIFQLRPPLLQAGLGFRL